jgi:hypothetical protein
MKLDSLEALYVEELGEADKLLSELAEDSINPRAEMASAS